MDSVRSRVQTGHSKEEVANLVARTLQQHTAKEKVLLLLSGGSSVPIGIRALSLLSTEERARIVIGMTDERYGAYFHADSNWKTLCDQGIESLVIPECHPILTKDNLSKEEFAERYARMLMNFIKDSVAIIGLFGIGADDHIAGILPESTAAMEYNQLMTAYDAGKFQRITITPSFFPHINTAIVCAGGNEKREAVERLQSELPATKHPDQLIKRCGTYQIYYYS